MKLFLNMSALACFAGSYFAIWNHNLPAFVILFALTCFVYRGAQRAL